ncbi:MAG: hypothetical protein JO103_13580 [Candidatus Eremiobacteraeota bacterium]|nr:hypothetical protein [Candidatus Eremiobacteraeota bacterium]MBV9407593.1 hypothetical protein [Candidatus Eremiobacteraeota bacterium]
MNRETIVTAAVVALVAGGVGTGFWLTGSPGHARLVALDERRVNDLQDLVAAIDTHYGKTAGAHRLPLPAVLPNSVRRVSSFAPASADDPVTHRPYDYQRTSASTYRLCATFATSASETGWRGYTSRTDWSHPAGRTCFALTVQFDPSARK